MPFIIYSDGKLGLSKHKLYFKDCLQDTVYRMFSILIKTYSMSCIKSCAFLASSFDCHGENLKI